MLSLNKQQSQQQAQQLIENNGEQQQQSTQCREEQPLWPTDDMQVSEARDANEGRGQVVVGLYPSDTTWIWAQAHIVQWIN